MSATKFLQQLLTLTKTVGSLEGAMEKAEQALKEHEGRLSKLENSAELTIERAKSETAHQMVDMNRQVLERVINLEHVVKGFRKDAEIKVIASKSND